MRAPLGVCERLVFAWYHYFCCRVRRTSFSAADPFTHCQGERGLRALASSGFALASPAAARRRSRASRGSILSSSQMALSVTILVMSIIYNTDKEQKYESSECVRNLKPYIFCGSRFVIVALQPFAAACSTSRTNSVSERPSSRQIASITVRVGCRRHVSKNEI